MKEIISKWIFNKDGTWSVIYKKRNVKPLSILDIVKEF